MKSNRYVNFVSDADFIECVNWVCDAYPSDYEISDIDFLQSTSVDPFKMVFDMYNGSLNIEEWVKNEKLRQADKTVNNRIGDFHQKLLGMVEGWEDLGRGHPSEVDLRKKDDSIFLELKNKYNTMNSSSLSKCRDKLETITKDYPKATAYWAYIVSKDGSSGEKVWEYRRKGEMLLNNQIKVIWGKKVYELITGDAKAMEKTWKALPKAIKDAVGSKCELKDVDKSILSQFSKYFLGDD